MLFQPPLDESYTEMPLAVALERITARKAELGERVCILGHHYQCDEVFRFADFTGDSLKLSKQAAAVTAGTIVFCGVHFMAESADILTGGERNVILPDLAAGCAMSGMAEVEDVSDALEHLQAAAGEAKVVPVTYVNSSAAIKAVTGSAGGACCTSSNARSVLAWALDPAGAGGSKVFALPDQHLARNTAVDMGYSLGDCVVFDPRIENGGLTDEQIRDATFVLWKGHCYVHQKFTVEQIAHVRKLDPDVTVMVHPECPHDVVVAADRSGSTEQILRAVTDAPAGTSWAIGTESNMVHRLAANNPDKEVRVLSDTPALCMTMGRVDPAHLLWVLDNLAAGEIVNRVTVPPEVAADARIAVERMISIRPQAQQGRRGSTG